TAGRMNVGRRVVVAASPAILALTAFALWHQVLEQRRADHAAGLLRQLLAANTAQVPAIIEEMQDYRLWTDPRLQQAAVEAEKEHAVREQLHVSLALLPVDSSQVHYLYGRLLNAEPHELPV